MSPCHQPDNRHKVQTYICRGICLSGLVATLFFSVILMSCRKEPAMPPAYTDSQRLQLDTTGNHTKNIDSLMQFVKKYEKSGERAKEMAAYAELGHAFQTSSQYPDAVRAHQVQLSIAEELKDTLMKASALNDLGVNYRRMGLYYDGLDYHLRAVETSMLPGEDADEKLLKCRAIGYNGAGNAYLTAGLYKKADEMLRKALAVETRLGSHLGMNVDCSNIGCVFERRGMVDSARVYFARSMYHSEKAGSTTGLAYSYMNFGRLYQKEGDYKRAIEQFRHSMEIINKNRDQWLWLQPCIALASAYLDLHSPDSALRYITMAMGTAQRIGTKEYNPQLFRLYSTYYRKQGNYKQALDYYVRANTEEDSILNARNLFEMETLQNNIARRLHEKNQALTEQRLQEERMMKWTFAIGFVLVLGLSGMLWYMAHTRKKAYRVQKDFMKMREAFFTNITHEFRTPLTVILGISSDMRKDTNCPSCTQDRIKTIERQGQNLLTLINQLLDISKIKSAAGNSEWRHGNIIAHLTMIIESYRDYAKSKNIKLQFLSKNEVVMDFVPDYAAKVMNNLLSNAFKFTPEFGTIDVLAWREGERFYIDVADTGTGISPDALPHIFEPFYQASTETQKIGTGIGLALVRQIISAMDGKISVESSEGKGTKFRISVPIRHEHRNMKPMVEEPSNIPLISQEETMLNDDEEQDNSRILIIEDNTDVAAYIGSQLTERYALSYAADGKEGIEKALEQVPDLIITDLMMPGMDGLEVCKRVRSNEIINHIPVIIVTAKITEQDRLKGLEAGADAYLTKPFNSEELQVRVEKLLEQRRLLRDKYLQIETGEQDGQEETSNQSRSDRRFMSKLADYIYLMISSNQPVDVNSVATHMCMSYSQFRRKLYALTGYTALAYIQRVKIKKAQQMLDENPQMNFSEVAFLCGFSDYSNFVRSFKNVHGITPKQYVKGG